MHTSQAVFASYSPLTLPNKQLVLHPYLGLPCLAFFFYFCAMTYSFSDQGKKSETDYRHSPKATGNWELGQKTLPVLRPNLQ